MKHVSSLLAAVLGDGRRMPLQQFLHNAVTLSEWLGATTHVLVPPADLPEFETLQATCPSQRSLVVHVGRGDVLQSIHDSVKRYHCDLIMIDDGREKDEVLELASVPVLYVPPTLRLHERPIRSMIVPLSGEQRSSEASRFALNIAEQTHTPVDFLHVSPSCHPCPMALSMEMLADQYQHEFPEMIDKVISEATPYSNARQRAWVRQFHHCVGLTEDEIGRVIQHSPGAALVVEWKGSLTTGRAAVVKRLMQDARHAIVFIKVKPEKSATLRIGRRSRGLSQGGTQWGSESRFI